MLNARRYFMSVVYEGTIKGKFTGFKNRDTTFEFTNGQIWKQGEYKYLYHYAYRPQAKIIDKGRSLLFRG